VLKDELAHAQRELNEAREQQAATSEILRVISSSPTDVQPVFDTIVRSAVRLCDGVISAVNTFDGELTHVVAVHNYTPEALAARMYPMRPSRQQLTGRAILSPNGRPCPNVIRASNFRLHKVGVLIVSFRSSRTLLGVRPGACRLGERDRSVHQHERG
jgi:two-component system NtrC family sensor kinase